MMRWWRKGPTYWRSVRADSSRCRGLALHRYGGLFIGVGMAGLHPIAAGAPSAQRSI